MTCRRYLGGLLLSAIWFAADAGAEAVLDGSTGSTGSFSGDFEIPAAVGRREGANLFHSFELFNIRNGESATFTGPGGIDNVISRVTGGDVSRIDGRLVSTIIGADFFFLNPAGVVFGPAADLDVGGSFHVSTADELRFDDGARFGASDPASSSFTMAPPESFGFLGQSAGGITVDRGRLRVPTGEEISLVGGDIRIAGGPTGIIRARSGQVRIAALDGANDVSLNGEMVGGEGAGGDILLTGEALIRVSGDGSGRIEISGGRIILRQGSQVAADNESAGDASGFIRVDADELRVLSESSIFADAEGAGDGGEVTVNARKLLLSGPRGGDLTGIFSDTFAGGDAGTVRIAAATIEVSGGAAIGSTARTGSDGAAGRVEVTAGDLSLFDNGQIISFTQARGKAGRVVVDAGVLVVDGRFSPDPTGIFSTSDPGSTGNAGSVDVTAGAVEVLDGGEISSSTLTAGNAGRVRVEADEVVVSGESRSGAVAGILSQAEEDSSGNAGDVRVVAGTVLVEDSGTISSSTDGIGDAGNVRLRGQEIRIEDDGLVTSVASGKGNAAAGRIDLVGGLIEIFDGGQVNTFTETAGAAGRIVVDAGTLVVDGRFSRAFTGIFSTAEEGSTGDAGTVRVVAGAVEVVDGGEISSSTLGAGRAGGVRIRVDDILVAGESDDGDRARIVSEADEGSSGDAGDVLVIAGNAEVSTFGVISSSTFASGDAGEIRLDADRLLVSSDALVTSTAERRSTGDAGIVRIDAEIVKVRSGGQINTITFENGDAGRVTVDADRISVSGTGFEGDSSINSTAERRSTGRAGSIAVRADSVTLRDGGEIASLSNGTGRGGDVTIRARDSFENLGGSVTAETLRADAGDIRIVAGRLIHVANGTVTTSAAGGTGGGGNIRLDPAFIVLNDGEVVAQALAGAGGDIVMVADNLTTSPGSVVDASSELGIDGTVSITGPDTDLTSELAVLSTAFVDASSLLGVACADRVASDAGSFTSSGGGSIVPGPEAPLAGSYASSRQQNAVWVPFRNNVLRSLGCR